MTKKYIALLCFLIALLLALQSCQHEPTPDKVLTLWATQNNVVANDTSLDTIYAAINWQGEGQTIVFTSAHGTFIGGTAVAAGGNTVSVSANINNNPYGKYTARAVYVAPLTSGSDTITAYIQNTTPLFIQTCVLNLGTSQAIDSIALSSSSPNVGVPYSTTANITAHLFGNGNTTISFNTAVVFNLYIDSLDSVGGQLIQYPVAGSYFFPNPALTNQNGNAVTLFNPAGKASNPSDSLKVGYVYTIKAQTVLPSQANAGSDTIRIYVN